VPTHYKSSDEIDARSWLKAQEIPVFAGRIRLYKAYDKAFLDGIPVFQVRGDAKAKVAWSDYQAVFKEVLSCVAD
jgi:chromosome partitioning protein